MRHRCNLRDLAQGFWRTNKRAGRTSLVVLSLFPTDRRAIPVAYEGVVCLNAKSRHCRPRYLCEHALVKHSSIWPVSRPTSSTRSPRRVSPTHAENHSPAGKRHVATWKERQTESRIIRCIDNRNCGNICVGIPHGKDIIPLKYLKIRPDHGLITDLEII